jgi:hypothetical protein
MRTGRSGVLLALAATVVVSMGSAAQSEAPPAADQAPPTAVAVTGTSTLVGEADPGATTLDGGVVRVRDNVLLTAERSTDPRVSGRATITVNIDAYPDPAGRPGASQVRYGRMRLVNADGTWAGRFAGSMSNGGFVQTYWLEGAGAYEGLSSVVTAGGNGPVWRSQGLIFPGRLPPLGGGSRLPIDDRDIEQPTAVSPPV